MRDSTRVALCPVHAGAVAHASLALVIQRVSQGGTPTGLSMENGSFEFHGYLDA